MAQVAFRRINGRIIPIKQSAGNKRPISAKDAAKSAALGAAGVGVSATAGNVAAELIRSAGHAENAGRRAEVRAAKILNSRGAAKGSQLSMFGIKTPNMARRLMESSEEHLVKSNRLFKAASRAKNVGRVAGAGLITAGAYSLLDKTKYKNDEAKKTAIAAGSGVTAQFAVEHFLANRLTYNKTARKAFGSFAKSLAKLAVKRI